MVKYLVEPRKAAATRSILLKRNLAELNLQKEKVFFLNSNSRERLTIPAGSTFAFPFQPLTRFFRLVKKIFPHSFGHNGYIFFKEFTTGLYLHRLAFTVHAHHGLSPVQRTTHRIHSFPDLFQQHFIGSLQLHPAKIVKALKSFKGVIQPGTSSPDILNRLNNIPHNKYVL
jgi:hypothetical protein